MASRALTVPSGKPTSGSGADAAPPALLHPSLEQGKAFLDALPYIDGELDHVTRAHVDRLVLEEMQNPRFPRKCVRAYVPACLNVCGRSCGLIVCACGGWIVWEGGAAAAARCTRDAHSLTLSSHTSHQRTHAQTNERTNE